MSRITRPAHHRATKRRTCEQVKPGIEHRSACQASHLICTSITGPISAVNKETTDERGDCSQERRDSVVPGPALSATASATVSEKLSPEELQGSAVLGRRSPLAKKKQRRGEKYLLHEKAGQCSSVRRSHPPPWLCIQSASHYPRNAPVWPRGGKFKGRRETRNT